MTNDKANALRERVKAVVLQHVYPGRSEHLIDAVTDLVSPLLAERERLRGALDRVREVSGDRASEGSNERGRLDHINIIARQALEATDDQT